MHRWLLKCVQKVMVAHLFSKKIQEEKIYVIGTGIVIKIIEKSLVKLVSVTSSSAKQTTYLLLIASYKIFDYHRFKLIKITNLC